MNIEELLDQIEDIVEKSVNLAFTGKSLIDTKRIKTIIEDIRLNMPNEIRQARAIVADRSEILANAKKEADSIISKAEEQARLLTSRDEITKNAQTAANELMSQAQIRSKEMRKAAGDYVDDMMHRSEETLAQNLTELRNAHKNFKNSNRSGNE